MKKRVLALIALPDDTVRALAEAYELIYKPDRGGDAQLSPAESDGVFAVITNGSTGCTAGLIGRLPSLQVISAFGAGYEKVDIEAARARSVAVTYAPGANAATVADHALGFVLALSRDYCALTSAVKAGRWKTSRGERSTITGSTVGIIGMGMIGQLIAKRVAAFEASVAYYNPSPRPGLAATSCASVSELAARSDFLIAACPGGKATRHIVDYDVLKQLGPTGYVINVARGSVVNTADLIRALKDGVVAGAGLDVLEEEPDVPAALCEFSNVLMTPHIAGRSPSSFVTQGNMLMQSLAQVADRLGCTYQVPELQRPE